MSGVQMLRGFIRQRLSAAAEEIFDLFERTIAEYEEELSRSKQTHRQHEVLHAAFTPEVRLHRADVRQLLVSVEEVPPQQQDCSSSLDQEDPSELPNIKEEQEEVWTSEEGKPVQVLEEADTTGFPFAPVLVKSEDINEEKPQSSQLHQRHAEDEDCGGPEPARNSDPDQHLQPAAQETLSHSSESETDDSSCDWEETREPQSGKNSLQTSEETERNPGKTSSERAASFGRKVHLQRHNGVRMEVKPFSCSVCGKGYDVKRSLATHMRFHSEGKHSSCSICKKNFLWRRELVRHMRIHTGEKPFNCSICGLRFAVSSNLISHMRVHTGEKPFICSVCETSFSVRGNLVKHMRVHMGEKPFTCPVCGNKFSRKDHLRQHLKIHTGEKPFSCSLCGKRFAQHGTLRRHWSVHTGEKRFSCTVCDKRFTRLHNVKKHKCVGESSRNK